MYEFYLHYFIKIKAFKSILLFANPFQYLYKNNLFFWGIILNIHTKIAILLGIILNIHTKIAILLGIILNIHIT